MTDSKPHKLKITSNSNKTKTPSKPQSSQKQVLERKTSKPSTSVRERSKARQSSQPPVVKNKDVPVTLKKPSRQSSRHRQQTKATTVSDKKISSNSNASVEIKRQFGQNWKNMPLQEFQKVFLDDKSPDQISSVSRDPAPVNEPLSAGSVKEIPVVIKPTEQIRALTPLLPSEIFDSHVPELKPALSCPNSEEERLIGAHNKALADPGKFTVYSCNGVSSSSPHKFDHSNPHRSTGLAQDISRIISSANQTKHSKRADDLLRLIELGLDGYHEMFNLQPMDEYSSYMLRFGQIGRCQIQTQTMEDSTTREMQTECNGGAPYSSWTQAPPDDENGYSQHDKKSSALSAQRCCLLKNVHFFFRLTGIKLFNNYGIF